MSMLSPPLFPFAQNFPTKFSNNWTAKESRIDASNWEKRINQATIGANQASERNLCKLAQLLDTKCEENVFFSEKDFENDIMNLRFWSELAQFMKLRQEIWDHEENDDCRAIHKLVWK